MSTITLRAERTTNLDTTCYRGSAPLTELAQVSAADVFDQVDNPDGLQRDLSRKHAAEAYDYVARDADERYPRAFPEVVLNVRDPAVVDVRDADEGHVELTFDLDKLARARSVKVSRVDGNHRLYYAAGDEDRAPLAAVAPFQIHVGLSTEQEGSLFLDINATQKGLNTSHLAVLRSRLTPDEVELVRHTPRVFARWLAEDAASPFRELVYMGGAKAGSKKAGQDRPVSFVSLQSGVRRTLNKSQYIEDLTSHQAQYQMVRQYWQAVSQTWPEGFEDPRTYYVTKNIGVQALSLLGAVIIDRSMASGKVDVRSMIRLLEPTKAVFDWHRDAGKNGLGGMSGNRAALAIGGELAGAVPKPK